MPTVIAFHAITMGKDHWLASPKREEVLGPLGVTNIRTFVDLQDPTQVAIVLDVPDMEAAMASLQEPSMREAMAHDGFEPGTLRILVEEKAGGGEPVSASPGQGAPPWERVEPAP